MRTNAAPWASTSLPTPPATPPTSPRGRTEGAAGPPADPALERTVVELTRALPRHGDAFLEPSDLPSATVAHFFAATLPRAPAPMQAAVYDRLLQATVERRHNLPHAGAIAAYLRDNASDRLAQLERGSTLAPNPKAAEHAVRQLRRLGQLGLAGALAERQQRAEAAARRQLTTLREGAAATPQTPRQRERAEQVHQLQQLSPLTRLAHAARPTPATLKAGPGPGTYRFVSGEGPVPVRGIVAPSGQQRGRLSRIEPLLLENGDEMVVRAAQVQLAGNVSPNRLSAAGYARQREAAALARSPVAPVASFYDARGELYEVLPRYDGDLVDLLQVYGGALPHLGVALEVADAVLAALEPLHAHADAWSHGDVKPDNVLWRRGGDFALADYGDARPSAVPAGAPTEPADDDGIFATAGFVAPERVRGQAGPAADLFALGVTLGKLLAPSELQHVPLALPVPLSEYYDEATRELALEVLDDAVAGYHAYQGGRRGEGPPGDDAPAYEALRAALAAATDAAFAALVVDRLLHPDPAARGSAAEHRATLQRRFAPDHEARGEVVALSNRAAQACRYTQDMDATFADMRRYRDGLLRTSLLPSLSMGSPPPPVPSDLESP